MQYCSYSLTRHLAPKEMPGERISFSDVVCDEKHTQLQQEGMPHRPPGTSFHSRMHMAVYSMNQTVFSTFTVLLLPLLFVTK